MIEINTRSRCAMLALVLGAGAAQAAGNDIPVDDEKALVTYLQQRQYQKFPAAEPEIHPSVNVHGKLIRTFLNKEMADGLRKRLPELPKNAGSVKEIYTPEGKLDGWAVSVKVDDASARGANWYWYEVVDMSSGNPRVTANALGNATADARLCVSCHQAGYDYVLTHLPQSAR